jgi:ATP-dependent RNA helicase DeaD
MSDPEEITVGDKNAGNVNIEHQYIVTQERDKYNALKRILDYTPEIFGLIFCRTRIDTQRIAESLMKDGYNADALHGDLNQAQRDRVMMKFRQKTVQILVATDVAARGIDVDNITHVIHMNMPDEMEFYTHRSGRTARAGKKGISIAMVSNRETGKLRQIEKTLKATFVKIPVPTGQEVCQKQLLALMHKVHEVKVNEKEITEFLPAVYEELKDLTRDELIKRFASLEFNRFLEYYRNAPDLNADGKSSDRGAERYSTGDRYFINLGKMDDLDVSTLLELLDDCCGVTKKSIGKIDLKGAYSFFEVDKEKSQDILKGFQGIEFAGRAVRVELTEQKGGGGRSRERSESGEGSRERGERSFGSGRNRSISGQRSNGGGGRGRNERSGSRDRGNRGGSGDDRKSGGYPKKRY